MTRIYFKKAFQSKKVFELFQIMTVFWVGIERGTEWLESIDFLINAIEARSHCSNNIENIQT